MLRELVKLLPERGFMRLLSIVAELRGAIIGPNAYAILTHTRNGALLVPPRDLFVGRKLCFGGSHCWDMLEFLVDRYCSESSEVLIVGAHVGTLLIPIAKHVKRVVGIEANPDIFDLLKRNVMLNDLDNVALMNLAAGDRDGTVDFLVSRYNSGGSKVKMGHWSDRRYIYDHPKTMKVEMRSLDGEVGCATTFDLVIMDIEGAETAALRGMPGLLTNARALAIEVLPHHLDRLAQVTESEFAALLAPYFDAAMFCPQPKASTEIFEKRRFPELVRDCCRLGGADVVFYKNSWPITVISKVGSMR
jgi:FkbM family methyltransferase